MFIMGSGYINCNILKKTYSVFKSIVDDSLTEVTADMLNGVTSISNNAFFQCYNLTSVEIPSSVTSIGNLAWRNCSLLTSVTIEATTPPTLGTTVFQGTHANLVIYVPSESVEAYKSANRWSAYASRIQAIT